MFPKGEIYEIRKEWERWELEERGTLEHECPICGYVHKKENRPTLAAPDLATPDTSGADTANIKVIKDAHWK